VLGIWHLSYDCRHALCCLLHRRSNCLCRYSQTGCRARTRKQRAKTCKEDFVAHSDPLSRVFIPKGHLSTHQDALDRMAARASLVSTLPRARDDVVHDVFSALLTDRCPGHCSFCEKFFRKVEQLSEHTIFQRTSIDGHAGLRMIGARCVAALSLGPPPRICASPHGYHRAPINVFLGRQRDRDWRVNRAFFRGGPHVDVSHKTQS
jgi:hypothetical protein